MGDALGMVHRCMTRCRPRTPGVQLECVARWDDGVARKRRLVGRRGCALLAVQEADSDCVRAAG
eukprot:3269692-Prymnesium_polylepis.2